MLNSFVERQNRTIRGNKVLIGLRLLLAMVSLAVLLIHEATQLRQNINGAEVQIPLYLRPSGLVTIIVCVLTLLYLFAAQRAERTPGFAPKLAFLQIFVDIFLISALVWNTGGVNSQFVVLYLISVCAAAFVMKWNVAILAAAVSATLFSVVTLLYSMDVIPDSFRRDATAAQIGKFHSLSVLDFVRLLLLPICAFFMTGLLAGTLSKRLASMRLMHNEILESIGDGIAVVDANGMVLYHNGELEKVLGVSAPLQHSALTDLIGPSLIEQIQDVLRNREPKRIELNYKTPSGKKIPLVARMRPICDPEDPLPRGVILAFEDITVEKNMEEFLKHRQRVETMSKISATIAHEIRNPLASIRGAVQEIGRSLNIPDNKKILVDIVLSESDRLDQIISDFLRFARMRPPKLQPLDMGRVLSDIKLLLLSRPEAHGVAIYLEGDEGDPIYGDAEQMRQLFLNLGVNALHALEDQPVRQIKLRIRVTSLFHAPGFDGPQLFDRTDRPGILIEVEDTGKGMNSEEMTQIFEPFFTTKATGTGLGLAIVERIVQAHDGLITVKSQEGQGTTFKIWFPTDLMESKGEFLSSGFRPAVV